MKIRPAISSDVTQCVAIDHSTDTDHVWQMEQHGGEGEISVTFRTVRLPRSMRVRYPRDPHVLIDDWARRDCFLVAEDNQTICGYLNMTAQPSPHVGWIGDLAVARTHRRQGVASALLGAAARWAQEHGLVRLMIEMQSKNYPAISLCLKRGFAFCGYNDRYYANQDIALYFEQNLRL
jgi:ribosomal protein S18 acetylase RimI-like enzyme